MAIFSEPFSGICTFFVCVGTIYIDIQVTNWLSGMITSQGPLITDKHCVCVAERYVSPRKKDPRVTSPKFSGMRFQFQEGQRITAEDREAVEEAEEQDDGHVGVHDI